MSPLVFLPRARGLPLFGVRTLAKQKKPRLPTGRYASKEEAASWAKEAKAQKLSRRTAKAVRREAQRKEVKSTWDRRKSRTLGKRLETRQTQARYNKEEARFKIIQAGKLPRPDAFEANQIGRTDVYQWSGLDAEYQIRFFLRPILESESPSPLTKLSLGTGYGRRSDWIGSWWGTPIQTWRWLQGWQTRPSAQVILDADDAGQPVWWELEVKRNARVKPNYETVRALRRKRTKKKGRTKRAVRNVRQSRKSATKGKTRNLVPSVRRKRGGRRNK